MQENKNIFTHDDRKRIMEKINVLSKYEHIEIFRIFKSHNIGFSQNNNGIFIDISNVPNAVLKDIHNFIEFCFFNHREFKEHEKKLNTFSQESMMASQLANDGGQSVTSTYFTEKLSMQKDNWYDVLQDAKRTEKISHFVNHLEERMDNIHKKRGILRFTNAKKKLARKYVYDRKNNEDTLPNVLDYENYPI